MGLWRKKKVGWGESTRWWDPKTKHLSHHITPRTAGGRYVHAAEHDWASKRKVILTPAKTRMNHENMPREINRSEKDEGHKMSPT